MKLDAITLAVMNNRLAAIADEMGVVLGHTAFSPNIKERHDFSCAIFDARGELVAQAAHIPVHLGSTPLSVRAAIANLDLKRGDVAALNDPFAGGTHLPDLTLVAPVFIGNELRPFAFAANRAHHADIGGIAPGSMALATEIYQEGFRLPPVKIVAGGEIARDVMTLFLANTRVREEREGDLRAQIAALSVGSERLLAIVKTSGRKTVEAAMDGLKDYAERLMIAALRELPSGTYRAEDFLDDDGFGTGPIPIRVAIKIGGGMAVVDFTGSAPQVRGSVNANFAITLSATFYVMKCLAAEAVPANEGLMRPIKLVAPPGSIVNALAPAAVAGGNVETSQRIVDVLFRALAKAAPNRIPAASSGSMSNLTVGGFDRFRDRHFSYYETIAGGAGAAKDRRGASGIHTHMTNTLNTPIEALESYYPMRITEYRIRRGSGGRGRARGGDGLIRELECFVDSNVSVLTERRKIPPYGLAGGGPGATGKNILVRGTRRKQPTRQSQHRPQGRRSHSNRNARRRRMGPQLDDANLAQSPALVLIDSKFRQDIVRIRSQSRCAASYPRRRARKLRRRTGDRRELAVLLRHLLQHVALERMRASRRLRVRPHLRARNIVLRAFVDRFLDGPRRAPPGKHRVTFFAMVHPAWNRREVIIGGEIVAPRHPRHHLPVRIEQHPRHHRPVTAFIDVSRNRERNFVAPSPDFDAHRPERQVAIGLKQHRIEHRDIDMLPFAGPIAMPQRRQRSDRAMQSAKIVA